MAATLTAMVAVKGSGVSGSPELLVHVSVVCPVTGATLTVGAVVLPKLPLALPAT